LSTIWDGPARGEPLERGAGLRTRKPSARHARMRQVSARRSWKAGGNGDGVAGVMVAGRLAFAAEQVAREAGDRT
jgi:hypothetical protein